MKRNPKPLTKYYMPLVLWREDLDEIASILQRREAVIQFEADDYSFEKLEELETHFGSKDKNELKITSTKPYVSIELGNRRAWLYVSAESPDASGVFFELDKVLTARQRRFPTLYTYWFLWLFSILGGNSISFILNYTNSPRNITLLWSFVYLIISVWFLWVLFVRRWRHSVITMRRRATTDSFVRRNKDQLAIAIIAAIVGAIIGVVGKNIIDKLPVKSSPDQTQGQP
jgi:uncharacterized membrane protein YhaH (DUF805 family)